MTTTALAKRELTPDIWGMIEKVAPTMFKSRLFGVTTTEQAAAIMLKGNELGLGLAASFEFIQVIQDKPALNPRGALALILQSGECTGLKIEDQKNEKGDPTACLVTMKRKNGVEYTTQYTMADAQRADLIKTGSGWAKYPANMLRWRAIGYCADVVFPDIIGGMKRADEFDAAISPDGDVISSTWSVVEEKSGPAVLQSDPAVQLRNLVDKYGATEVLTAGGGKIPATTEEVEAVAAKLNGGAG